MLKSNEQFNEAAEQTINTAYEFIQASLENVEKLTKLNLHISKKLLNEASDAIKEIASTTNPNELMDKISFFANKSVENHLSSCRDIYEAITDTQLKMGKVLEDQLQSAQQNIASAVDNLAQLNPNRNNFATDSLKSWINTTNQAMNAFNKMAEQVTEFTNNNVRTAAKTANATTKKSTKK